MAKSPIALANSKMLAWARKTSGFTLEDAARKIGVNRELLEQCEKGTARFSLTQLRKAAEVYKRPLAIFYLSEPPPDFTLPHDYRKLETSRPLDESPGLLWEIRQAHSRRAIAIELAEAESGIFAHHNTVSRQDNPEQVASAIREWLGISRAAQFSWRDHNDALNAWKDAVEKLNVLVFHTNHQGVKVELEDARGFSISTEKYPVVVLNSKDLPQARSFTLFHELTHLLMNNGGVCNNFDDEASAVTEDQRIEIFCNRVAGAVLVPQAALLNHTIVIKNQNESEWDEIDIVAIAKLFCVSREVILRRLLLFNRISQTFYQRKRAEYLAEYRRQKEDPETEKSASGFAPYFRMILRRHGKPFTRLVLDAYNRETITVSDVADYLDVQIKHILQLEQSVFSASSTVS